MKFIFLALYLYSASVFSGEKIVEVQSENYIARGYSENKSKEPAKIEACNIAKKELITFVFGATYQLNQNMIRSLGVMDYSQDVSINTGEVVLRGVVTELNQNDGLTKCTVTYPIQEANIEKERLKSTNNNRSVRFTDVGDPGNIKGGILEVVTIPEDTDVYIDNVRWGTTPLRLNGKLNVGTHILRLDNPSYKVVEEKIEIGNISKIRVDKILKRATGKLKITTDPDNAVIKINDEEVARSPTDEIELLAGQKLKIEMIHPESEANIQYITLIRDETRMLNQKLLLKPGFISLSVTPSQDVSIAIDGVMKPFSTNNSWIQLEAGKHEVSVSAKNYSENTFSVYVNGGERKALSPIELVSLKEIEEKELAEEKRIEEEKQKKLEEERVALEREELEKRNNLTSKHFLLGFESNFNTPNYKKKSYGLLFGVQKSLFNNYLGIQLSASLGAEDRKEQYNTLITKHGKPNSTEIEFGPYSYGALNLSIPIYLGSFYLKPGIGIRHDEATVHVTKYNSQGYSTDNTSINKIKTNNFYKSFYAGFIFPKNDEPSKASVYIEGGVNKYQNSQGNDPTIQLGFRWNFR